MARTARVCGREGCPEIVTGGNYCSEHKPQVWANPNRPKTPPGWARLRASILYRANNTCTYCGAYANEVDHVIPVSQGGSDRASNLVAACTTCNKQKNYAERIGRPWSPPNRPTE